TASKDGFITVNGSVTITDQNGSDFAIMLPAPPSYYAFFWCSIEGSATGVEGIDVTIDGLTLVLDLMV
ncbi:hypothetical protein HNS38_20075, partial [Lentimicrobium sp. L6]|uniref:hypothetical protein n=1 Tax=Lentimicrobium sp. L6 TaxID=2735916 RepID=UPI0015566BA5